MILCLMIYYSVTSCYVMLHCVTFQGPKGSTGEKGAPGDRGPKGDDGINGNPGGRDNG